MGALFKMLRGKLEAAAEEGLGKGVVKSTSSFSAIGQGERAAHKLQRAWAALPFVGG